MANDKKMGNEQAPKAEGVKRDRATEDGYYLSNPAAAANLEPGTRPSEEVKAEQEAKGEEPKVALSPDMPMEPYVPVEDPTNQPAEGVNPTPYETQPGEMRKGMNLGDNTAEELGQYKKLR